MFFDGNKQNFDKQIQIAKAPRGSLGQIAGHLPGFHPVAGGQGVQETEMLASIRGTRIVQVDHDGVRANMSASWLAQMGREVNVLEGLAEADFSERGPWQAPLPTPPAVNRIFGPNLKSRLAETGDVTIIDLSPHAAYQQGHKPGAWFAQRSRLAEANENIPPARMFFGRP